MIKFKCTVAVAIINMDNYHISLKVWLPLPWKLCLINKVLLPLPLLFFLPAAWPIQPILSSSRRTGEEMNTKNKAYSDNKNKTGGQKGGVRRIRRIPGESN